MGYSHKFQNKQRPKGKVKVLGGNMLFLCLLTFFSVFAYLTFTVSHYACSISTGDQWKKTGLEKIICPGDCGAKLRKKCAMLRQPPSTRRKLRLVLLWWLLLTTAPHWFRLAYMFLPWLGDLKKSLTTLEASLYKLELTWAPQGHPLHYLELWCRSGLNPPFKWESS